MSDHAGHSNPFATRYTRPGAVAFLFPEGDSAASLIDRLRDHDWQGAIVGPHGAGKSTLLASLLEPLHSAGRIVVQATLHQGESAIPKSLDDWRSWTSPTQVIVDGYEQLTWWSRSKLARRVKERRVGLLVTSHAPVGLPVVMTVAARFDAAWQVVRQLSPNEEVISREDVAQVFRACDGNIREMLFQLYDLYESRVR